MTLVARSRRHSAVTRRVGYLVATACGVVMLYLVNVWPGWQAVPFLTAAFPRVLGLLNFSLAVGVVLNAVYVLVDPRRWKPAGELLSTAVGLAVLLQVWRVFPFDFAPASFDWALPVRGLLVLAIVGCVVGLLVQLVTLALTVIPKGGGAR